MPKRAVAATNRIAGRVEQQLELQALLVSKEPEFLAVYGRRRVGKTYLVRSFLKNRTTFFELTGRANGTTAEHLQLFAESFGETFLAGAP